MMTRFRHILMVLTVCVRLSSAKESDVTVNRLSNSTWHEVESDQKLTQEDISRRIIHLTEQESFNQSREIAFPFENQDGDANYHFKRDSDDAILTEGEALPQVSPLKMSPQLAQSLGLRPQTRGLFNPKFLHNPVCSKCSLQRNLCQIVSGIFTRSPLPYGYSLVTHIPAGICNITIMEVKPSKNFFAVRRKDSTYALNGNWKIQAAGSYVIGGTIFRYSPTDGVIGEKLQSTGPLREPIDLMLIYQSKNPGIRYEYRIPFPSSSSAPQGPPRTTSGTLPNSQNYPTKFYGVEPPSSKSGQVHFPSNRQGSFPNSARYPYQNVPSQSSGLPVYHQRPQSYSGPSNIPLSKNWGPFYPVRPTAQPSPRLPKDPEENGPKSQRYPEIIQTDPEIITPKPVKVYNFAEVPSVHNVANFTGTKPHRTRHQHGQRTIYPGPAVDENRNAIPSIEEFHRKTTKSTKISRDNSVANDEQARHNHKKKRKKKKSRRRKDRYQWVFKGLTKCSRSCGGGNQTSVLSCEKKRRNKVVSDKRCVGIDKPEIKVVSCNLKPCPAEWMPNKWSECSVTCGNGTQKRDITCKQEVSPTLTLTVQDGACQTPSKHKLFKTCNAGKCPTKEPSWRIEPWSNCSSPCGNGTRTRKVHCVVWLSEENDYVCEKAGLIKPKDMESCSTNSCASNGWHFSEWSDECLGHCGTKTETRLVFCMADDKKFCPADAKPPTTRSCTDQTPCTGIWFSGEWSECSVSCGIGHETRPVECLALKDNRWRPAPLRECQSKTKPLQTRECVQSKCSPKWYITEWSECSKTCGEGTKTREAKCLTTEANLASTCSFDTRPHIKEKCNVTPCQKGTQDNSVASKDFEDSEEESNELADDNLYDEKEELDNTIHDNDNDEHQESTEDQEIEDNHIHLIPRQDDPDKYTSVEENDDPTEKEKKEKEKKLSSKISCIDRIKNCHLVFRARLCRLKYYNKLCCETCKQ